MISECTVNLNLEPEAIGLFDPLRLEQVIINLVTNAMKYAAGKPIDITLRSAGQKARLEVKDQGIGIDPCDQERIFGRFERAVSLRNYGGLGLGLYISRQIVEFHEGRIFVESMPNDGARFIVDLPLCS